MPNITHTIWCQWPDLSIPENFKLISKPLESMCEAELSEITFYIPKYMGGTLALSWITKMPNLNIVQLLNAGYEDAVAFLRPGLLLFNAAGVHDHSTAELALALILAKLRFIPRYVANQKNGYWEHLTTGSLADKTVAIVGYGSIGKTFELLIKNFPIKILRFAQTARKNVIPILLIDDYLPSIDVVVLFIPLTDTTKNLFDSKKLNLMKPGSLIINVARGGVINTDDLLAALRKNLIHAALDVTDPEPLPVGHPLWSEENLLIVPHIGGDSSSFDPRARKLIIEQLLRISQGRAMINEISWAK